MCFMQLNVTCVTQLIIHRHDNSFDKYRVTAGKGCEVNRVCLIRGPRSELISH